MTELADAAIEWYQRNARDLPWREPGAGAWPILVSEVMLQQTPVARVEPVWREWVGRWPTPAALAADAPAEAIRVWGRLGYPRRALRLHECARALVDRHGGEVPRSLPELLALPGVGSYTARAVAAFAYHQPHPVVDTNVRRLVARCVAGEPDGGSTTTEADLTATAALLPRPVTGTAPGARAERPPHPATDGVPEPAPDSPAARAAASRAAAASVAFMEIGALVCTARDPSCHACPLADRCAWRAGGRPLPAGPSRRPQRYAGTDRQVRGELLAVLREATGPVPRTRLDQVWADAVQRDRALATLIEDGLVHEPVTGRYALGSAR